MILIDAVNGGHNRYCANVLNVSEAGKMMIVFTIATDNHLCRVLKEKLI